ncbi:MAG: YfhO family protein [Candidatus Nitrohelix vancouverensis]|uniref:YfhO family protein n=1 Tax=Candidatus Nitrohelix vancouverensis TaxID=2705534 RepID=A0A7T0G3F9_9BACT|nr:MAG: YfhO family protein [Candidatus Nitrohelix vancouverensis]
MNDSQSTLVRERAYWLVPSLLFILLLKNLPSLFKWTVPVHDTLCNYESFYFFYNDLLLHNDLPSWTPFIIFGMPTDFEFIRSLTVGKYLAGLIGWIFSIQDTLFLYSFAFFTEELVLLYGMYKLSDRFFKLDATVFYVCMVPLLSIITVRQPGVGFHVFFMYPLMFHLLLNFLQEKNFRYFFSAGIVFVLAQLGALGYTMPLQLVTVSFFFFFASFPYLKEWRQFFRWDRINPWEFLTLLALLSAVAVTYYQVATHSTDPLTLISLSRDPGTSKVPLESFLTYGYLLDVKLSFLDIFWPIIFKLDFPSLYIGIIPFLFVVYSLFRVRNRNFYCIAATGLFLFLFALGGRTPLAAFLYEYFPFMHYFRHVSHAVAALVIIFAIMSGFGFDKFFSSNAIQSKLSKSRPENIVIGLVIFNLGVFQMITAVYYHNISHVGRVTVVNSDYYNVNAFNYQPVRNISRSEWDGNRLRGRQRRILFNNILILGKLDYRTYNHLQWDVCLVPARIDFAGKRVFQLFEEHELKLFGTRGGWLNQSDSFYDNRELLYKLGCDTQKMRIVRDVEVNGDALTTKSIEADIPNSIRALDYRSNHVKAAVNNPFTETSYLYYADSWDAGWKAKVNGEPTQILRANTALKAVAIPPGNSTIEFSYEAPYRLHVWILIVYGLVLAIGVVIGLAREAFTGRRSHEKASDAEAISASATSQE